MQETSPQSFRKIRARLSFYRTLLLVELFSLAVVVFLRFPYQGLTVLALAVIYLLTFNTYVSIKCPFCSKSFKLSSEWGLRRVFRRTDACANCGKTLRSEETHSPAL